MLIEVPGHRPQIDPTAWVAPNATIVGQAQIGARASIWYGAVIRADIDRISIGADSNIQDNSVLHTDEGMHLQVGTGVVVGHAAVLHGCRVDEDVIVGMGAILLNHSHVGSGSIIGAGALIPGGARFPARSLLLGSPAKVVREVTDAEVERVRANAQHYVSLSEVHAGAHQAAE